jgi:serine/threonine-protein kinase ULK/ATG1
VLKCFEIFTSNRNCYIITEAEANPIIKDVYDGLVYLGQNNIVHRDLKSANIFLHNGRAKIADFGFAKEIK